MTLRKSPVPSSSQGRQVRSVKPKLEYLILLNKTKLVAAAPDNQQMMESDHTEGTQGKPTELPIACAAHAPFGWRMMEGC